MKKIIQVCSLFTLIFLFTAVSASAQSNYGSEVQVPFAFNVGNHSYEAGTYIVRVVRRVDGSSTLAISDTKTDETDVFLLNANGDDPTNEVKLVFDTIEGRRYLTKVRTPIRTFALHKPKVEKGRASVGEGSSIF
jgi:hypothetical protein